MPPSLLGDAEGPLLAMEAGVFALPRSPAANPLAGGVQGGPLGGPGPGPRGALRAHRAAASSPDAPSSSGALRFAAAPTNPAPGDAPDPVAAPAPGWPGSTLDPKRPWSCTCCGRPMGAAARAGAHGGGACRRGGARMTSACDAALPPPCGARPSLRRRRARDVAGAALLPRRVPAPPTSLERAGAFSITFGEYADGLCEP